MCAGRTIHIRSYQIDDQVGLIELVRELQRHELQFFDRMKPPEDIGVWYVDELQRQCRESAGEIIVLECDQRIAGYATVLTEVRQDAYDEISYTYALVGDLAIAGDMRNQGFGTRLLDECEIRARKLGAKWLRVSVLHGNEHALKLYLKRGFHEHIVELEKPLS